MTRERIIIVAAIAAICYWHLGIHFNWGLAKVTLFCAVAFLIIRVWVWLCCRFPLTMTFVNAFIAGLMGVRRYRRW